MRQGIVKIVTIVLLLGILMGWYVFESKNGSIPKLAAKNDYWLVLHRKSNKEFLYSGEAGSISKSQFVREFDVKVGIPGQAPTPLPKLLNKQYWRIIDRDMEPDSEGVGPHFLTLDIPTSGDFPYGPVPYEECYSPESFDSAQDFESSSRVADSQCSWQLPGYFGLHGVGGDMAKLSKDDPGSLGCVRHSDSDIVYLYNTLDPKAGEIRYYVEEK